MSLNKVKTVDPPSAVRHLILSPGDMGYLYIRAEVLNLFMLEITLIQCNLPEDQLLNCRWNPP
jgi:hypothetical protein